MLFWGLAIFVWVLDKVLCPVWLAAGVPYLHSVWHVLVAIGPSYIMTICMYLHTMSTLPNTRPNIRYWPKDWDDNEGLNSEFTSFYRHLFSVPYIVLEGKLPLHSSNNSNNNNDIDNTNKYINRQQSVINNNRSRSPRKQALK